MFLPCLCTMLRVTIETGVKDSSAQTSKHKTDLHNKEGYKFNNTLNKLSGNFTKFPPQNVYD